MPLVQDHFPIGEQAVLNVLKGRLLPSLHFTVTIYNISEITNLPGSIKGPATHDDF